MRVVTYNKLLMLVVETVWMWWFTLTQETTSDGLSSGAFPCTQMCPAAAIAHGGVLFPLTFLSVTLKTVLQNERDRCVPLGHECASLYGSRTCLY